MNLATRTRSPDLSVIVVSYNTRTLLQQCLESICSQVEQEPKAGGIDERIAAEIIVIDNASSDGSQAMVRAEFPRIRLLENVQNAGFARACNQGLNEGVGRLFLLLNPDAVLRENALTELIAFLDSHPTVGLVGPKLIYPDGSFQHSSFRFPTLPMTFLDFFPINHRLINSRLNGRYPRRIQAHPFAIDHPLGACMLVRREAVDDVGLLDESFFMYCEEVDWCYRLKSAGWSIYCVPSAVVVHHSGASARQMRGEMFVELHRSRYRLFRKHYSRRFFIAAKLITRLGVLRETVRTWLAQRRGEITVEERRQSWRAYGRVFRLN